MPEPEPFLKNEMHKILWDSKIQIDHLITARRPDRVMNQPKSVGFEVQAGYRVKIKDNQLREKYLDLARELKSLWKIKETVIPIVTGGPGNDPQRFGKGVGWYWNWRRSWVHRNYRCEIKSFGLTNQSPNSLNSRRLAVLWKTVS